MVPIPDFFNLKILSASGHEVLINQIGSDSGLLSGHSVTNQDLGGSLLIAPGERADTIIDFTDVPLDESEFIMVNNAPAPFPGGTPTDSCTTGRIVKFVLSDHTVDKQIHFPLTLPSIPALVPTYRRYMELNDLGTILLLNNKRFMDPNTDFIQKDSIEEWWIINLTPDAHPIHLHQVHFQVVFRQNISIANYKLHKTNSSSYLEGSPQGPLPNESGFKDVVKSFPGADLNTGTVTVIRAKFDILGKYVWHCHILEHEDNDMMRPYEVINGPSVGGFPL